MADLDRNQQAGGVDDAALRGFHGYRMKRATQVVLADLVNTLKPFDLRILSYSALVMIVANPGLRQSELAKAMDVERPNLVEILDQLEQRKLITRTRVPEDRRAYAITPTPGGKDLHADAVAAVQAHEDRLFGGWDAQTISTVTQAMDSLHRRNTEG